MNIQENQQDNTMPIYLTVPSIVILSFISMPAPPLMLGVIALVILRNKELKKLDEKNQTFNQSLKNQQNELRKDYNNLLEKQDFVDDMLSKKDDIQKEADIYAQKFESTKEDMQQEINKYKDKLKSIKEDIYFEYIETDEYEDLTSEEVGNELSILRLEQKELVKDDNALDINIDGTKSHINNLSKKILRSFNNESEQIILKVTEKNIETSRNRLIKSFEQINKLYAKDGIQITTDYLNSKLEEMTLVYNYELKKEQEKEIQRAIKEQMVEEEKVRKEVDNEKKKIEKEEKQFKGEVDKLMKYLQKTDDDIEKTLYADKIRELEEKIGLLEKDKENVLQREQNTRAGFVYIISNIGSFGENIYKIGMTRRLEPMDRIKELSSASVPFSFDVHAMIFSEDAPTLENDLHKAFKDYEVNKVNPRKEFFNVNLDQIESVVKEKYNNTVDFIKAPKFSEYLESFNISEQILKSKDQSVPALENEA